MGIQLRNENKLEDMSKIIEEFHHSYVPTKPSEGSITLDDKTTVPYDDTRFFKIILGGDQLTVARGRGTAALRASHDRPQDRFEGIVFSCEDFHCRMVLMKVS